MHCLGQHFRSLIVYPGEFFQGFRIHMSHVLMPCDINDFSAVFTMLCNHQLLFIVKLKDGYTILGPCDSG